MSIVIVTLMVGIVPAKAYSTSEYESSSIETLANGYYIETSISIDNVDTASSTRGTKTATKTRSYKNSSGDVMWSASITGTFSYNGNSATCTSCSHSATAYGSTWSIKSVSSSRSGNSATTYATAIHHMATINVEHSMSVTISCSADGTIS